MAGTGGCDWSEGSGSTRPSSAARTGDAVDPKTPSSSDIIAGMRAASVSSVSPLPRVRSAQRSVQPPSSADAMAPSLRGAPDLLARPGSSHPPAGTVGTPTQGGERADSRAAAAAPAGARLAAGGDTWRAPAVAYNAVERRIGRDATALRAVSARLDAAASAIDAVEVGVRSASDSLDSLLHLLESRPVAAALSAASAGGIVETSTSPSTPSDSRAPAVADIDGVASRAGGVVSATGVRPTDTMYTGASRLVARLAAAVAHTPPPPSPAEIMVQGEVNSGALPAANTEPAPSSHGGGIGVEPELFAPPRVVQRETGVSTPLGGRLDGGESAEFFTGHAAIASAQRGGSARAQLPVTVTVVLKAEEEPTPRRDGCERVISPLPSPEPSAARGGDSVVVGSGVEGQEGQEGHDGLGGAGSVGYPWRAEPARTEAVPRTDEGVVTEVATSGAAPLLSRGNGAPSEEDRSRSNGAGVSSRRTVPGGRGTDDAVVQADLEAAGTGMNATREGRRSSRVGDASNPVLELEAAMDGIDAERERLIVEIARLRGQQNESLIHLQRLQHEQFVVRQRQVSTLSDIVNSFGRTVEAAGALPHGEDSSLGRISGDVVSTLRRMLRLLSATVPVAAESAARATPVPAMLAGPVRRLEAANRAALLITSASGPYSIGGRVALRPAGDLTQEVIDAALQALPRLAAAATAISGARRIQGFLAGEEGGEDGGDGAEDRDTGRRCSVETIAALPDAPPNWEGGGGDGGGSGGGVRGCVICLSEENTAGQLLCHLPCHHVFHRVCVGKWLRVQDSCPTCRRQVPDVKVPGEKPAPEVA